MMTLKIAAVAVATLVLAGCVTDGNQKEMAGTLLGAGLGGLAGSKIGSGKGQLAAVAAGTLAGAFIGRGIGQSLDNVDKLYAERAITRASVAPVGQTIAWNNPDTGNRGTVTAVRDGTNMQSGAYCREYQTTVQVGGKSESAYGTSCRQPDGSWQIVH
ncbi:MAG: glycine zipper 2TM domain-containing protein [Rhodospirillales bacterium]|nr:glycine zipper 2TM domain-containing protein [Rhodospirillales bacterium]